MAAESRDTATRLPRLLLIVGTCAEVTLPKILTRWDFRPPKKIEAKPLAKIWRPERHVLLSEAVELIGRARFGDQWTGEEIRARRLDVGPPELLAGKNFLEPAPPCFQAMSRAAS